MTNARKHIIYEQRKAMLQQMNLSPAEYEKALREIAKELKI